MPVKRRNAPAHLLAAHLKGLCWQVAKKQRRDRGGVSGPKGYRWSYRGQDRIVRARYAASVCRLLARLFQDDHHDGMRLISWDSRPSQATSASPTAYTGPSLLVWHCALQRYVLPGPHLSASCHLRLYGLDTWWRCSSTQVTVRTPNMDPTRLARMKPGHVLDPTASWQRSLSRQLYDLLSNLSQSSISRSTSIP